jgi:hypothetical protein
VGSAGGCCRFRNWPRATRSGFQQDPHRAAHGKLTLELPVRNPVVREIGVDVDRRVLHLIKMWLE